MAQWEEYYTGELPHAMGNFGVTEVNYGLGLITIIMSFLNREKLWTSIVGDCIPTYILEAIDGAYFPSEILAMELRHFGVAAWVVTSIFLVLGSFYRVLTHKFVSENGLHFTAVSKLMTPFLIAIAPFLLPSKVIETETRYLSVASGLLMSFLTKKMICFSMAKQTYATIQIDAIPFWVLILWIRFDDNITDDGVAVLLGLLCIWQAYRLISWASTAIDQICTRLDINCFSIKDKKV